MIEEAKILSSHNLDCSSIESLAVDISNRLDCNIEYGKYQNDNGNHHYVALGTVEANDNGIRHTLFDLRNNENSSYQFVLELGEEAKLIYTDFIDLMPPWEEDYHKVEDIFNRDGFANNSYYLGVFHELQKLGADKVYFIKDTFAPELAIPENPTMDAYLKIIQKETTFFEVVL